MKVLHIITALTAGGAGHQLRLLIPRLPHDSEVATLAPPGAVAAALRAEGTVVHELAAAGDLASVDRLRRLIRHGRYDLVHTHRYRACVQGRFAARLAGLPRVVATEHHPRTGARYRTAERCGRLTIAVSTSVAEELTATGVPPARITVIPKAVDPAEFRYDPGLRAAARARLGIAPDAPVIGGVGRLEPGERFDRLIRAVGEVPGATLLLVGDGSARPALERLATIEGVADRVRFAGAVGHAREMLCAMDVFASPDRTTFGLTVLEALAAGLPALYATCDPLADRGVDGARRLSPHDRESLPRGLRAEVLSLAGRHGGRLPARTAGPHCDADRVAAAVDEAYARVVRR